MSMAPSHIAYVVKDRSVDGGAITWHEVGKMFAHKTGTGFELVIPYGISVSGRIVCVEPLENSFPPESYAD
jgi:hypothetical protein